MQPPETGSGLFPLNFPGIPSSQSENSMEAVRAWKEALTGLEEQRRKFEEFRHEYTELDETLQILPQTLTKKTMAIKCSLFSYSRSHFPQSGSCLDIFTTPTKSQFFSVKITL